MSQPEPFLDEEFHGIAALDGSMFFFFILVLNSKGAGKGYYDDHP